MKPRCAAVATCRGCGCTDADCRQCVAKTGEPCHWVEPDLCSACQAPASRRRDLRKVVPQSNGNALLIFAGDPVGIYASEERASAGIGVLERVMDRRPEPRVVPVWARERGRT